MRTVVQVWVPFEDRQPPSSLAEAFGLAARAVRSDASRSERLLALRLALLDRYPLVPAAEGEPSVWADDVLGQERPGPSWEIAIAPSSAYEVRPYVIALAGRFGLDACDRDAGEVWLASGEVYSTDDRGPCVKALAAWRQGDFAAAHDALCVLAEAGNATALWHLGTLYDEGGGFVQCNALIACALFGLAIAGQENAEAPTSPAAEAPFELHLSAMDVMPRRGAHAPRRAFDRLAFTRAYRQRIGAEMSAAADELQVHLRVPGAFREALREAGGPRDTQFALAIEALARGDVASAWQGVLALAGQGHVDAQRTAVRLWCNGEVAPPDARRELDWTRVAAQAGDDAGMSGLAALFEEGVLVPRDPAQAAHWLRRLVRRGRTAAMRDAARERLARHARQARDPQGAPAAPGAAAGSSPTPPWREGARRREPQSLLRLGRLLAFGHEAQRDRVAAQALFVIASRLGATGVPFLAPEQADPRAVRHLLALIGDEGDPLALVEARQAEIEPEDEDAGGTGDDGGAVAVRPRGAQALAQAQALRSATLDSPATMPTTLDAAMRRAGREPLESFESLAALEAREPLEPPRAMPFPSHDEATAPTPFDRTAAALGLAPASLADVPPGEDRLHALRPAFDAARPAVEEQSVALRRAGVALTGAILLAVLAGLWLLSFEWIGAAALWLLAGACSCRAAVQGARIAGDSAASARLAGVVAFLPVAGQVLAALLMHRAGRALHSRLAPSQRAGHAGPGRARQRLRPRAARATHAARRGDERP